MLAKSSKSPSCERQASEAFFIFNSSTHTSGKTGGMEPFTKWAEATRVTHTLCMNWIHNIADSVTKHITADWCDNWQIEIDCQGSKIEILQRLQSSDLECCSCDLQINDFLIFVNLSAHFNQNNTIIIVSTHDMLGNSEYLFNIFTLTWYCEFCDAFTFGPSRAPSGMVERVERKWRFSA